MVTDLIERAVTDRRALLAARLGEAFAW